MATRRAVRRLGVCQCGDAVDGRARDLRARRRHRGAIPAAGHPGCPGRVTAGRVRAWRRDWGSAAGAGRHGGASGPGGRPAGPVVASRPGRPPHPARRRRRGSRPGTRAGPAASAGPAPGARTRAAAPGSGAGPAGEARRVPRAPGDRAPRPTGAQPARSAHRRGAARASPPASAAGICPCSSTMASTDARSPGSDRWARSTGHRSSSSAAWWLGCAGRRMQIIRLCVRREPGDRPRPVAGPASQTAGRRGRVPVRLGSDVCPALALCRGWRGSGKGQQ